MDRAGYCFYGPQLVAVNMGRVAKVLVGQGMDTQGRPFPFPLCPRHLAPSFIAEVCGSLNTAWHTLPAPEAGAEEASVASCRCKRCSEVPSAF